MKKCTLLLAMLTTVATPLTFAHGVWVAQRIGEPTIILGEAAIDDAYNPDNLTYVQAYDTTAQELDLPMNKHEKNVSFGTGAEYGSMAIVFDNGYWTEQANGTWVNKSKDEVKDGKRSGHYIKTALNIAEKGQLPSLDQLKALPLVILPEDDVTDTDAGDTIDVVVYFEGKPLADVKIEGDFINAEGTVSAETNEHGKASIEVRNDGLNVIEASYTVDAPEQDKAKGDKIGYTATLSFVNKEEEH